MSIPFVLTAGKVAHDSLRAGRSENPPVKKLTISNVHHFPTDVI